MRIGSSMPTNGASVAIESSDQVTVPTSPAVDQPVLQATSPYGRAAGMSQIDISSPLNYGTPSSMGSIRTPRSGVRGTPMRQRPDLRVDKLPRQVNVGSSDAHLDPIQEESQASAGDIPSSGPRLVVWGTNVVVTECMSKFKQFILRYIDPNAAQDELTEGINLNEPLYMQKLEEVKETPGSYTYNFSVLIVFLLFVLYRSTHWRNRT